MAAPSGGRSLFTRQSSGLVREVSVVNALFFNTAAFIGGTLGGAFGIAVLAGLPVVVVGVVTNWSIVAFVVGAFVLPAGPHLRVADERHAAVGRRLRVHQPDRAQDRAVPGLARELDAGLRLDRAPPVRDESDPQGHPDGGEDHRDRDRERLLQRCQRSWFTEGDSGDVTGVPGMLASLVVIAVVAFVVLQPTRRFHKIVT